MPCFVYMVMSLFAHWTNRAFLKDIQDVEKAEDNVTEDCAAPAGAGTEITGVKEASEETTDAADAVLYEADQTAGQETETLNSVSG